MSKIGTRRVPAEEESVCGGTIIPLPSGKGVEDLDEERWEVVRARRMQDAVKDKEVLTQPSKKVRQEVEQIPKDSPKAPTKRFQCTYRQGSQACCRRLGCGI